jgi:hypothetical protein
VALARGLKAKLLRRRVLQAERGTSLVATRATTPSVPVENTGGFVPVKISPTATEAAIRIEVRRGSNTMSVEWARIQGSRARRRWVPGRLRFIARQEILKIQDSQAH